MIILYGAGEGFGLPEISPYVTKTEVQLRMAGVPYEKRVGRREDSPKGQVPYIDAPGGVRIGDSTFIRGFLERTYGIDFDEGLTPEQRATAWAVERMMENHFSWAQARERWLEPVNFAKGPAHFFDGMPEAVRDGVQAEVQKRIHGTIGRHSDLETVALGVRSLAAVAALLGDKPFLFGQRPCGADATVFALLAAVLTPYFDGELKRRAEGFGTLVAYVDRLMARFYPEFDWDLETSVRRPVAA